MRKTVQLEGINAPVVLSRRKGTRNIKISLASNGTVRLSIPFGAPEIAAMKFALSKADWINERIITPQVLRPGAHIGKSHTLYVEHADITRPSTKVSAVDIRVRLPAGTDFESEKAQSTIRSACEKALLKEAKVLLPQRTQHISQQHDISYKSVTVKKLKSRWGACDNYKNISLNSYLIQLEWHLIDYVISHELAHTIHHNHSANFWEEVERMQPNYKLLKKQLKDKQTDVLIT